MKRIAVSITIVAMLQLTTISSALGCSCAVPRTPTEELGQATAVFSGKVMGIGFDVLGFLRGHSRYRVKFDVERTWKGSLGKNAVVLTETGSAACGYAFQAGERYLVYTYTFGEETLNTSICNRTARLADAQADLAELGAGSLPVSDSATGTDIGPGGLVGLIGGVPVLLVIVGFLRAARRRKVDLIAQKDMSGDIL